MLDTIVVGNTSPTAGVVGLQVNSAFGSDFRNVVVTFRHRGAAIRLRKAQFNRFHIAAGHAEVGLHLTADYVIGNVFTKPDIEGVETDVVIDTPTAAKNVFLGGQYVWTRVVIDASAGNNNTFVAPNFASGGLRAAVARSVGIVLLGEYGRRN